MRKYLIQDVISKRVQLAHGLNCKDVRQLFQDVYRRQLLRIVGNDPQVYCLHNIQNFLANSTMTWYQSLLDDLSINSEVKSKPPKTVYRFLDEMRFPLVQFPQEVKWMESNNPIYHGNGPRVLSRGWMIYLDSDPKQCLVFVEFNRFANGRIEMSSVTDIPLGDSDQISSDTGFRIWDFNNDYLVTRQRIIPTLLLHLPIFALNILRTKEGFSMPIEEQGRRQLASRIGVHTQSGDDFFSVGPRMKHFVRGHFRVCTAGRQYPLTTWVHPHTRGNRRPMQPAQHRRMNVPNAIDGSANALLCTKDG